MCSACFQSRRRAQPRAAYSSRCSNWPRTQGVAAVAVHAFLDGRDTPPQSARASLERLQAKCAALGNARIATIGGRYYAMDRDKRWERVELAYDAIAEGESEFHADGRVARARCGLRARRERRVRQADGDSSAATDAAPDSPMAMRSIYMNFRADRARQLTQAFVDDSFAGFRKSAQDTLVGIRHPDRIQRRPDGDRDRLSAAVAVQFARRISGVARPAPAAHRRDGKVRACDVLLLRRPRGTVCRRRAHSRAEPESRDLRSQTRDELSGTHRSAGRGDRDRRVRFHRLQYRQRRHGRPHRQARRGDQGRRSGRRRARPPDRSHTSRQAEKC